MRLAKAHRTIGPRIRISRCDDASGRCSVSNRPDQRNGSCPFKPPSTTHSTFNAILFPATRSASSEGKRCRTGGQRQRPELEPSPSDFRLARAKFSLTTPSTISRQMRAYFPSLTLAALHALIVFHGSGPHLPRPNIRAPSLGSRHAVLGVASERQQIELLSHRMPKRAHSDAGRTFDHGSSRGSARGSQVRGGIEACWQRRSANPASGGGREKTGFVAGRPDPSRGAKAADPIWAERDRGEEDQRDPEIPLLFLGSDPLDDRSGGDPVGGGAALAGLRHHPASASCQRNGRILGRASGGQRHRRSEGDAGDQGQGETRRASGSIRRRANLCPATPSACASATSCRPTRACWTATRYPSTSRR